MLSGYARRGGWHHSTREILLFYVYTEPLQLQSDLPMMQEAAFGA